MQTIKCVVVGDGAVGKVRPPNYDTGNGAAAHAFADMSADIVHDEQVP